MKKFVFSLAFLISGISFSGTCHWIKNPNSYVKKEIELINTNKMNLKGTLRYYGLSYVEDRSFFSKYKDDFNLKDMRSLYNLTLGELCDYKDRLIYSE